MISNISVSDVRFFPGCTSVLDEKTMLVRLQWDGHLESTVDWHARWSSHCAQLRPGDPLWGLTPLGLPADCVAPGSVPMGSAACDVFAAWAVALTVGLQRWARQPVWQGAVVARSGPQSAPGGGKKIATHSVHLALPFHSSQVGSSALQHALSLLRVWASAETATAHTRAAAEAVNTWLQGVHRQGWQPNTLRFFAAARRRQWPTGDRLRMLQLGQGCHMELLDSSFTGRTSGLAGSLAKSKQFTSYLLGRAGVPVPTQAVVSTQAAAEKFALRLGWPVVVKPANQDKGLGVTPDIRSLPALQQAFAEANRFSPGQVIVEQHVPGCDYRLLVVGGVLRMATLRTPGGVTGDGVHTVQALLDTLNQDPLRGTDATSLLIHIPLDAQALDCLSQQSLTPACVPVPGRFVRLRRTANASTGGTAHDATGCVHPDNRGLAERAARIVGLDIAGIDLLIPDISRSWREVGGAICEVNGQPAFRVHWLGAPDRDINAEVLDWLYEGKPQRIPTAAITGTNGKTTVARMLHHIWRTAGVTAGVCTTQGVWMGDELISQENLSGFPGGRMLLEDPAVQAAVIELPRKGLLKFGHPCDRYDVAALLNVQDDHLGVDGVDTLEQMAELKAQALTRARHAVVINADDPLCLAMRERVSAGVRHVLVSRDQHNRALQQHLGEGGQALCVVSVQRQDWVVWAEGATRCPLMPLADIPATSQGLLRFNETNALFAMALAHAQDVPWDVVCKAMRGFGHAGTQNPGRYHFIEGLPFQVLLDFGHNPVGVTEVCRIAAQLPITGTRYLMAAEVGSRHKAHWPAVASVVAQTFDRVVVSCYPDYVEKSADYAGEHPVEAMLANARDALVTAGMPATAVGTEQDRSTALANALALCQPGDLLVLLMDYREALPKVESTSQKTAHR